MCINAVWLTEGLVSGSSRIRRLGGDGGAAARDPLQDRRHEDDGQVADGPQERHRLGQEDFPDAERIHQLQGRPLGGRKAEVSLVPGPRVFFSRLEFASSLIFSWPQVFTSQTQRQK